MVTLTKLGGGCHCGNIRFKLLWPAGIAEIPARTCGCTFCRKHGGTWTSHRLAELSVTLKEMAVVSKYRFGTKTAEFYICRDCGVPPLVVSEIDDNQYAVVNVNTLEDVHELKFAGNSTDFDGESTGSRLERRKLNWIPGVSINTAAG